MSPEYKKGPLPLLEEKTTITIAEEYRDPINGHTGNLGYLAIFQEEREAILTRRGIDLAKLADEEGLYAFMTEQNAKYKGQSAPGDEVTVFTTLMQEGLLRLNFNQTMNKDKRIITEGNSTYIFVNEEGKPQQVPEEFKSSLQQPPQDRSSD